MKTFPLYSFPKAFLGVSTLTLVLSGAFTTTLDAQTVLYRQVFGNSTANSNLNPVNWGAYEGDNSTFSDGSSYSSTLRTDASAPGTETLGNVNSAVEAASLTNGIGFFYVRNNPGDLYIPNATEQAAFGTIDFSDYSTLDFSVYSKSTARDFRFVVEVGGVWLASDLYSNSSNSTWDQHILSYTEDTSSWYVMDFTANSGNPISISANTLAGDEIAFPTGDITNFGIFLAGSPTTAVSFDAFEVSGTEIPEPSATALVAMACVGGLLLVRRRRLKDK
ncbi:PEP-CTERM sorting domain-containing protein [Cerasicoccus frondis]|uniref:PEP-CTERM sorting domain-containing protein n=1 Tax=Cerasicoccus frondis TaxID=490090 RepID=UPI0028527C40|nr:PEP-CTERM sorting domain-containing protein [Cerasicoccus frondis]